MNELTVEVKNMLLAKTIGWKFEPGTSPTYGGTYKRTGWFDPQCRFHEGALSYPDYYADLNACAELRKALPVDKQGLVGDKLVKMRQKASIDLEKHLDMRAKDDDSLFAPNGDGWFAVIDFTAAECAEAVGLVLGLWTEADTEKSDE